MEAISFHLMISKNISNHSASIDIFFPRLECHWGKTLTSQQHPLKLKCNILSWFFLRTRIDNEKVKL